MFLAIYATIMTVVAIIMTLGYIGLYIENDDTRKKLEKADFEIAYFRGKEDGKKEAEKRTYE